MPGAGEKAGRFCWPQHAHGVGIEGDNDGDATRFFSGSLGVANDFLVAEMHAIENADCEMDGSAETRYLVNLSIRVHRSKSGTTEFGNISQGQHAIFHFFPTGRFECGKIDVSFDGKFSAAGATEFLQMSAASQDGTDVVGVGPHVKSLAANDAEFDVRKCYFLDFIMEDGDGPFLAFDFLALASEFVKGDAVFLDGTDHRRELVEVALKLIERGGDLFAREFGHGLGLQGFALTVLRGGGGAKADDAFILLFLSHEEVLNFGGAPDNQDEQASGHGIERAAVADLTFVEASAGDGDDVVGGHVLAFVHKKDAIDKVFR